MRYLRPILSILLGSLSVVVIALNLSVWLINFVNWDRHKAWLVQGVESLTPFRVETLDGIRLRLTRTFVLEYQALRLETDSPQMPLKRLESGNFRFQLAVWPLLSRKLAIQELSADGIDFRWQSSASERTKDEAPAASADSPWKISIAALNIKNSEFRVEGEGGAPPWILAINELSMNSPDGRRKAFAFGNGQLRNLPFTLIGESKSVAELQTEESQIPFWTQVSLGEDEWKIEGSYAPDQSTTKIAADLRGPNIEQLKQLFHLNMGTLPAYALQIKLELTPQELVIQDLQLQLGRSQAQGQGKASWDGPRPKLSADLDFPLVVHGDLSGLFKTDKRYKDKNEPPKRPDQYFSSKALDLDGLKSIDLAVCARVKSYDGAKAGTAIRGGKACLNLDAGKLTLDPLAFQVGGGNISGRFELNGQLSPPEAAVAISTSNVDLSALLGPIAFEVPLVNLKPKDMARGKLRGNLDFKTKGASPLDMAKNLRGPVGLLIEDGALSSTVIEAFGLDLTQAIASLFKKDLFDMPCSLLSLEAKEGKIETKAFLIATEDTSIIGKGDIDLMGNKVDYRLTAHPHDFSVGSFRSPITIKGPLNEIKVGLEKKEILVRATLATALGALINPALALLPLVETGLDKSGRCSSVIGEIRAVRDRSQANR